MKYFYDTEFLEDGSTIELISIGIVAENGDRYYAVNSDMPIERIKKDDWLLANVWPSLPLSGIRPNSAYPGRLDTSDSRVKPRWVIANEVRDFLLAHPNPELWADYAAYDHVALCQLWGRMIRLPKGMPMFTRDFQQLLDGAEWAEPARSGADHNALDDALHLKACFESLGK